MFRGILSHICVLWLGAIIYAQVFRPSAAAATRNRLALKTSVVSSDSPIISGDKIEFKININHEVNSKVKVVDGVMRIKLPAYLKLLSYDVGDGIAPTTFTQASFQLEFKFAEILVENVVNLTFHIHVDPFFINGKREQMTLGTTVDFWYYKENGPCARPVSMNNAEHRQRELTFKFFACEACEQRIESTLGGPMLDNQYFASSFSIAAEASRASLTNPGSWKPAERHFLDRTQFLQIDFRRLIKFTRIETRGTITPLAFVRSYYLYYSKDLIDWLSYRDNDEIKEFKANDDGEQLVGSSISMPLTARYIRIVPRTWSRNITMKVQIYGCPIHPVSELRDYCPIFDFESGLNGWEKSGTAFDNQPTLGDNMFVRTNQSAKIQGNAWIATAEDRMVQYNFAGDMQGDGPTGTLTSPKFMIGASKLYFLIGGTADPVKARAELLVDGTVVRTASGNEESLAEKQWNVTEFIGKEARLRLVDDAIDGHLNFDSFRLNCHLDADAEDIPLPSRSILLNPSTHNFYVCLSSHLRHPDKPRCRMTAGDTKKWIDLPDIRGLLGVDNSTNKLYAVSKDRHVIERVSHTGRSWQYITRAQWEEIKFSPTMVLAVDVHFISDNGGGDEIIRKLDDSNGDAWRASKYGVSFKPAGGNWVDIGIWYIQAPDISPDACYSNPCQHNSKCVSSEPGTYNCMCLPGYTGVDCEEDIDYCANHDCLNDARCVDSTTQFFCVCKYGYTGQKCETELSACRTSPCWNGGTCANLGSGQFKCTCPFGHRGTRCEIIFNRCKDFPCRNGGQCVPGESETWHCICPDGFEGTNCETARPRTTSFVVVSAQTITETYKYKVIKATIPSTGKSLLENWCRDYEQLCGTYGAQTTGFGRSYNLLEKYTSCRDHYSARMDNDDVLGANPNIKVAELAVRAGFSGATAQNSFVFNECDEDKCSDELPDDGCDLALGCISKAVPNFEVYTVCILNEHNFKVHAKAWAKVKGYNLLMMTVNARGYYSKGATWANDYQKLCDSYGLLPIGRTPGQCQRDYNSIKYNILRNDLISASTVHLEFEGGAFQFEDCSQCSNSYYYTDDCLHNLYRNHIHATACSSVENTGFTVLDQKQSTVGGFDYLAIKVHVPNNGHSSGVNWCNDYQTLCESYGRRPLGCGACPSLHHASTIKHDSLAECPTSKDKVKTIANAAGFPEASDTNSFALNDCVKCSSTVSETTCSSEDIFCLDQNNPHRILYAVCLYRPMTALQSLEVKSTTYKMKPFVVIKTYLPENGQFGQNGLSNWCEEYEDLCLLNGALPTGCGLNYSNDPLYSNCRDSYGSSMTSDVLGCGSTSEVVSVAQAAGFSASSYNTFAFHQCSLGDCLTTMTFSCYSQCTCHPAFQCVGTQISRNSRHAYAVCAATPQSAFTVLDTKTTIFNGKDILVIKAQLPADGVAKQENWCEDYRQLCYYYSFRPTACGADYSNKIGYEMCRSRYKAVMSEDNEFNCPPDTTVAAIAKSVGFTSADSVNSFAFSNCSNACVKLLLPGSSFIDVTVPNREVYTVCSSSNSNFQVISTSDTVFNDARYLLVEARVPSDFISKHVDWCTDYERMCESFGLRPVAFHGRPDNERLKCIQRHGAINTKDREAADWRTINHLGQTLGYHSEDTASFVLNKNCDEYCYNDLKLHTGSHKGLYRIEYHTVESNKYRVHTTCASSDSNFRVLASKQIVYNAQSYRAVMAELPNNGKSKYDSWCTDYERLCRMFMMRPTGCGISNQWSSKYTSCVDKYQSAMADNDALGCGSSETVAEVAKLAGFNLANSNNSFMFNQCSKTCPKQLTNNCLEAMPCLNNKTNVVYTVCTDSSSAFNVYRVEDTREFAVPILVFGATLPSVIEPKNENWCIDYQKLCASFGSRPIGCDVGTSNSHKKCADLYNAIALTNDLQRCGDNGYNDVHGLVNSRPGFSGGYFKFGKCGSSNCGSQVTKDCHDSLYCLQSSAVPVHGVCSRITSNFEVVKTETTSYQDMTDIVVVKATVPVHAQSLYDTWCEDYENLCSLYKMQPLGCPSRPDSGDIPLYRGCERNVNGYLITNTTLTCPLHKFVAEIARNAGVASATETNSLALSTCNSCSKTLQKVLNGSSSYLSLSSACPPGANCSKWVALPNPTVHMLCVKLPQVSTFVVRETKRVRHHGRDFTIFRLNVPHSGISSIGNWCTDYQKLCESVSMRPIGCGNTHAYKKPCRDCRIKYNAIMLSGFGCDPSGSIAKVLKAAGWPDDSLRTFGMYECNDCGAHFTSQNGLHRSNYVDGTLYTACGNSDSGFEVLQTNYSTFRNSKFMVIKALLPENLESTHASWCKDYQMLCESYGKRPLTCPGVGVCKFTFNALTSEKLNCKSGASNLHAIVNDAGFPGASEENTFVFSSCDSSNCSRLIPKEICGALGCVNASVAYRVVYTMCLSSTTAYDVIATKDYKRGNYQYLVVQVKLPQSLMSNDFSWCKDYITVCREFGFRPGTCESLRCVAPPHHAVVLPNEACPVTSTYIAKLAGMTNVVDAAHFGLSGNCHFGQECKKQADAGNCTIPGRYPLLCYDRTVNDGEFTTLCVRDDQTQFAVNDYKTVEYAGRKYTVIRTNTANLNTHWNWCNHYVSLCNTFRMRPLACPMKYMKKKTRFMCTQKYSAVSMENTDYGCPLNEFVAELAQMADFPEATPWNSFAFNDCDDNYCTEMSNGECHEGLYCLNTQGSPRDMYTVCTPSDSGFDVLDYKMKVTWSGRTYTVIKVSIKKNKESLGENWCYDYRRLCESFGATPIECYQPGEDISDVTSFICHDTYRAARLPCGHPASVVHKIAVHAGFTGAKVTNTFAMHKCDQCPRRLANTCEHSLKCAKAGILYAVCYNRPVVSGQLETLNTQLTTYGRGDYLLLQVKLKNYRSRDWIQNYIGLCSSFGYLAIACGRTATSQHSSRRYCETNYGNKILISENDDFSSTPYKTIALLAQQNGFYDAVATNTFALDKCGDAGYSYNKYLSSGCYSPVPCLVRYPANGVLYTMCAKPAAEHLQGFTVLDKKPLTSMKQNYLAVRVKVKTDGVAALENWCVEYRELCRQFGMVPTGCGNNMNHESSYAKCRTKYNSFMPYSNILQCKNSDVPALIARQAGFSHATRTNTFLFNDCGKCTKTLDSVTEYCNSALHCLNKNIWNKEAYTLCVDRPSGFEFLNKEETIHAGTEYVVVEAALPAEPRAVHDNWCQDYQKLCYSLGKFPVACESGVYKNKFSEKYGAVVVSDFACPSSATVISIVKGAGYTLAKLGNSFVFSTPTPDACQKYLPTAGCANGLDCLNAISRVVYTLCTNPTNFEVSESRVSRYSQNTFTVIKARLPAAGISKAETWCNEYMNLCRVLRQRPVACRGFASVAGTSQCVVDYDAFALSKTYRCDKGNSHLYKIATSVGFSKASFSNTFGLKDCSSGKCQKQLYDGQGCDPSLNCVNKNVVDNDVYAICLKDQPTSNFVVEETKEITISNVLYLAIKARVPHHGQSKHDTWCKDYERMCLAYEMRPVRCSSRHSLDCIGQFNALTASPGQLDCNNKTSLVKLLTNAGFNASPQSTFIYGACSTSKTCQKTLSHSKCDNSLSCLQATASNRNVYTVCARSLATSFIYREARTTFYTGFQYLVIKADLSPTRISTNENWCYDYRDMCATFGKRPISSGNFNNIADYTKRVCFQTYNATSHFVDQLDFGGIRHAAGFDHVNSCIVAFYHCQHCLKKLDRCPFGSCSINCKTFYVFCM